MAWTPERTYATQKIQIGAESTTALGTSVAASKLLECFDWQLGPEMDVNFYTPTGHLYPSTQEQNTEWLEGTLGGNLDYNGIVYPLAGLMGSVAPATHLASATAKDWIFTPPITSVVVPQTYTLEQGDSSRAHKVVYGLFTEFGYKGTRKDFSCSGKFIAQPISDGITLTPTPTAVAIAPVVSKHINVYLDATSAGLGTTQLNRVLSIEYQMSDVYDVLWVLNRATIGWTAHVNKQPKCTVKLKVEADAAGMAMLGYVQSGATYYLRVDAQGQQIASDGPGAIFNAIKHDMAIKFGKPSKFEDEQGVFAIEWEGTIVEDPAWDGGKAQTITVTNLLGAL